MSDFENAKVLVKQGWLQGYVEGDVKVYKGIPYAAPPVGDRRFRHPEDPERWRGVRKATQYSAAAIQHVCLPMCMAYRSSWRLPNMKKIASISMSGHRQKQPKTDCRSSSGSTAAAWSPEAAVRSYATASVLRREKISSS